MSRLTLIESIVEVPTGWIVKARFPYGPEAGGYGEVLCQRFDDVLRLIRETSLLAPKRPAIDEARKCLVCALDRPWGIYDENTGATVCIKCRDKARDGGATSGGGT